VLKEVGCALANMVIAMAGGVACAQETIPADIGVTLNAAPDTNLVPGQPINLTISVTNYGPGSAGYLVLQSSTFFDQFSNFVADPNECHLFGTVADAYPTPYYYLNWEIANVLGVPGSPPFASGETRTCHLQFALTQQAPGVSRFSFGVPSYFIDLNQSNDVAAVVLRQARQQAPALSRAAMMVLAALLALSAAANQVRRFAA